jgi:hypothetical protein
MFQRVFGSSVYRTLDNAYPGKFKPWQLKKVPQSYWNKKTGKEATLWLIEEKFKWTDKEICENLSVNCFCKNGLNTMLFKIFNGSPYQALNAVYPGRFKPWQLASVPQKYWNEKTAKEAIIWLIEENLQWSDEQLCQQLSYRIFYASGLTGMIVKVFNGSPYRAIQHAYPGKFIRVGNKLKKVV